MAKTLFAPFLRQNFLALLSLLLMMAICFQLFYEAQRRAREQHQALLSFRSEQATTEVEQRMGHYIQILRGAKAYFVASDSVSRSEWKQFVTTLYVEDNYPGILGIAYAQVVKPKLLARHERSIRAQGFPTYRVTPEGTRDLHSIITLIEPFEGRNLQAFGFDMWSEETRRTAMERARDTNQPALTGNVKLVQETDEQVQPGFLIYLPVYRSPAEPQSQTERERLLRGFVYIPFRAHDLFDAILHPEYRDLHINVYDGASITPDALIYGRHEHLQHAQQNPRHYRKMQVKVAGRTWTLVVSPSAAFESPDSLWPYGLLAATLIISLLIFFIIRTLTATNRSNQLKQIITDNATAALFMTDSRGYCTFMNPAAAQITGYTFDEIKKKPLHDLIHHHYPDGRPYPRGKCPIDSTLATRKIMRAHEDVFIRKDGTYFSVLCSAIPIFEDGLPVSTVLEVRDTSELKEAERRVKENAERLQKVFYHVPAMVGLLSASDKLFLLVNPQFSHLFGNRQLLGRTFCEALPELCDQGLEKILDEVIGTGKPYVTQEGALAIDRHNNSQLTKGYFNFVYEPIPGANGQTDAVLIFGIEVTELVQGRELLAHVNQELHSTNQELQRINTDLDNFVYAASHDLKSPITNIEGLSQELHESLRGKLGPEDEKLLELMEASAVKLRKTVQELSEITKVQKQIEESVEPLQFQEVLDDVLADMKPLLVASQAQVEAHFEVRTISYARKNLRSILYNLVSNAVRYRSPNRPALVSLSTHFDDGRICLTVEDNGLGIKKEQQHKLFTMFSRLHSHVDGSGIGLYIVKRIIENNSGRIEVESEPGEGSVFKVWF